MKSPASLVLEEFGCYYLVDEVGVGPSFGLELERLAADSAARLTEEAGVAGTAGVVEVLKRMRDERADSMYAAIATASLIRWNEDAEIFSMFQQLVDAIVARLVRG